MLRGLGKSFYADYSRMESPDWVSLSDQELLERRISKLGLRLRAAVRKSGVMVKDVRRALRGSVMAGTK